VTPFAAKLRSGQQFIGIGLSNEDLERLSDGTEPLVLDLGSIGVGLWVKEADGSRNFLQPRDTKIVLMMGDSKQQIGELLQVDLQKRPTE